MESPVALADNATSDWVVTYKIDPCESVAVSLVEFYRGSETECRRIAGAFAGGECDLIKTDPWSVIIGPSQDWDDFLAKTPELREDWGQC